MSAPIIRKISSSDLDAVVALNNFFVPKVSSIDRAWLEKYMREADFLEVCEENGRILAFLVGMKPGCDYGSENFKWFKKRYDDFIYVDRIAVSEEAHGRGLGKALYASIEGQFQGQVASLVCEVNIRPENPQSYQFHTMLGFTEVGQEETKNNTIRVAFLMKTLK